MPIHSTDTFSGIKDLGKKGLSIHWTYSADKSGEGYHEPVKMFNSNVNTFRDTNGRLPEQVQLAVDALEARAG
jgi:hypothetical protein